jgi:hypothetical protein
MTSSALMLSSVADWYRRFGINARIFEISLEYEDSILTQKNLKIVCG